MDSTILHAVLAVFAVIAAGSVLRARGILNAETEERIFSMLIWLLSPALIVDSILGNPALADPRTLVLAPILGFASIAIGIGVSALVARCARFDRGEGRTFAYATGLYNYGFLALPLAIALFDKGTVGLLFVFNVGVEAALWGFAGFVLASGSGLQGLRRMINPPLVAIIASIGANLLHADRVMPPFLHQAIQMLGRSAIPVALLLSGSVLAEYLPAFFRFRGGRVIVLSCLLRLGLLPLIFLAAAFWLPLGESLRRVVVLQAAMPGAVLPILLARHYGGCPETAFRILMATSLVGFLTIPFWLKIGLQMVGQGF